MKEKGYGQFMTVEYKQKHFKEGCFSTLVETSNSVNSRVGIYVAFIGLGVLLNPGFIFGGLMYIGKEGVTPAFFVCMGVGIVWLLLSSLILRLGKARRGRTSEDWIALAARRSCCPEQAVREFEQQLRTMDSYVLTFGFPANANERAKRILTQDYIGMVSSMGVIVFPIHDIIGAGLVFTSENTGRTIKKVPVIGLFTKETDSYLHELADLDLAREFLALLKEKNPAMDIRDKEVMEEKEFFAWEREARS